MEASDRRWPKLQVALDLTSTEEAVTVAEACHSAGVQWLEAGTPLIKSEGLRVVGELKRRFPSSVVVADLKTLDTGWLEVELAARAGSDIVTVAGLADPSTIRDAARAARNYGVRLMVDTIGIQNPLREAREFEKMGADIVCFHTGIDAQRHGEAIDERISQLSKLVKSINIPAAAAGGINLGNVRMVVEAGVRVVIVGRAITQAENQAKTARLFLDRIEGPTST